MRQFRTVLLVSCMFLVLLSVCCAVSSSADPLDNWNWRNPMPPNENINRVIHADNTFVGVGANGVIVTSTDGATWKSRRSGTVANLVDVTYGNGLFVAVGSELVAVGGKPVGANGTILTSPDGASWTIRNLGGTASFLNGVAYGNGVFVAVGQTDTHGVILTSPDAATWRSLETTQLLRRITYANGIFVGVGDDGAISTSPDGVSWTSRNSGTTNDLREVAYGNGLFVAGGQSGTIVTSPDGTTWTSRVSGTDEFFVSVRYVNGIFVAAGNSWCSLCPIYPVIFTSPDGVIWTKWQTPAIFSNYGFKISDVTYANGLIVVVGWRGEIFTTSDGIWTYRVSGTTEGLNMVAYGNGLFVAGGGDLTSTDGVIWTYRDIGFISAHEVTYGNGLFVVVGARGAILTSPDGVTWTSRSSGTAATLTDVTYGNGIFVAVGWAFPGATIITSSDGITWTTENVPTTDGSLSAVTYGNGTFVVVGPGTILTSQDGKEWARGPVTAMLLSDVAYGNGTFVAVGDDGAISTSPDGVSWTSRELGTTGSLGALAYGHGVFVALGTSGTPTPYRIISTSLDGVKWTTRNFRTGASLGSVTYGNGTFVIVGSNGTILQSDPLPPYVPRITANGLAGSVTLKSSDTLSLQISLGADEGLGPDADWWVAANTPMGWFYYVHPGQWYYAPLFPLLADLKPAYQGPLFNLPVLEVLNISGLPAGSYIFYFGVDTAVNGVIDDDRLQVEYVDVTSQ